MARRRKSICRTERPGGKRKKTVSHQNLQVLRLVICSVMFAVLVVVKVAFPEEMSGFSQWLYGALQKNIDVEAAFSTVGRTFSDGFKHTDPICTVQHKIGEDQGETAEKTDLPKPQNALTFMKNFCKDGEESEVVEDESAAILSCFRYSAENLPENVCMTQSVLNFPYISPVEGVVSSGFGYREHPVSGNERFHYGVDLAAERGTDIRCFTEGKVTAIGESTSYGKYCTVEHADGFETLYAHCDRISASAGDKVSMGQKLGEVGETGVATGAHLHFELHRDGVYLNPIYYVE